MSDHAKLSPSARYRWAACPGSVRESAKVPERPSSAAAIEGTHTHTVLEYCIKHKQTEAKKFVGFVFSDHEGQFSPNVKQAERVQFALDYIAKRLEDNPGAEVIAEERVDPAYLVGRGDMSGTVDVQLIGTTGIEIIDYKDGFNTVKAEGNPQMEMYALGIIAKYMAQGRFFEKIAMTIIQPKSRELGGTGVDTHITTVAELLGKVHQIKAEAAATDDPEAPLVPGDAQCKYCPAAGGCRARAEQSFASLGVSFDQLSQKAADKQPNEMSDEELREIIEAAPLIRQMLDGAVAEAQRRFEAGHPVAGLKLVNGRGSRSWAFPDEEMADKLKRMGVPKDVVWKTSLISPAQAEKAVWEKTKAGEKVSAQLTPRQLKTLETEYIKQSAGKPTVVPESDSRPAAKTFEVKMFDAPAAPTETLPSWLV
jgi:hypothetical protein